MTGHSSNQRSLSLFSGIRREPRRALAELSQWLSSDELKSVDVYEVTELLECEVATKLGKAAGLWFPTGKMAQQVALRIYADARKTRTVAGHPQSHIAVHEEQGPQVVHDLVFKPVGDRNSLVTLASLEALLDDLAAVTWELPQRDIGGQLPAWDDLAGQVAWAKARGAAAHCDGARIWQCTRFYGKDLCEIASLFDSVYVSLWKDLEAPHGAVLTGEADFIRRARLWRHRLGGNLSAAWPLTAPALMGLRTLQPRMGVYQDHATKLAEAIASDGLAHVVPFPIQASMFHVHLPVSIENARVAHERLRAETGVQLALYFRSNPDSGRCSFEINVGENALAVTAEETAALVRKLIRAASSK